MRFQQKIAESGVTDDAFDAARPKGKFYGPCKGKPLHKLGQQPKLKQQLTELRLKTNLHL